MREGRHRKGQQRHNATKQERAAQPAARSVLRKESA
jgi:hypothetical protein